jgi:superfamily I DNA/RNA helicase
MEFRIADTFTDSLAKLTAVKTAALGLNTERQLLYVACTRARDFLLVSGTTPASEFLTDLRA